MTVHLLHLPCHPPHIDCGQNTRPEKTNFTNLEIIQFVFVFTWFSFQFVLTWFSFQFVFTWFSSGWESHTELCFWSFHIIRKSSILFFCHMKHFEFENYSTTQPVLPWWCLKGHLPPRHHLQDSLLLKNKQSTPREEARELSLRWQWPNWGNFKLPSKRLIISPSATFIPTHVAPQHFGPIL